MAAVYSKRGVWYMRFKDRDGKWAAKASGAQTKAEAKRDVRDLERIEERIRLGLEAPPLPKAPLLRDALV